MGLPLQADQTASAMSEPRPPLHPLMARFADPMKRQEEEEEAVALPALQPIALESVDVMTLEGMAATETKVPLTL